MSGKPRYACPEPGRAPLIAEAGGLRAPDGRFYPFADGTDVPVFASAPEGSTEYAAADSVAIHDNALRWVFATFGGTEEALRRSLVARLQLAPGQTVLVTGAGTGNDLPLIAEALGSGTIYALDIARPMLLEGVARHAEAFRGGPIDVHFSVGDAMALPFADGLFDAVYHFGGLNLFPDIRAGIAEMDRVVRRGGRVVFSDEGMAPWLKPTEYGRRFLENNPLYAFEAPLPLLPETARDVRLSWEVGNCFYVIDYATAATPPPVDIDVRHLGRRGGSVRTRYEGRLEGIDPVLRDRIYAEAEARGTSRVDFLEELLRTGLAGRLEDPA